jgi:hypothetical protein
MRTRFFQLPGDSFISIGLQTGNARAIEIDNASGSWLLIPSMETYIPPYTIGWSMDFPYAVTSLDIIAGQNGPAGQISTNQGSGVTVYLTDGTVGSSPGSPDPNAPRGSAGVDTTGGSVPFISGFTGILSVESQVSVTANGLLIATLISPLPTERIRLLTLAVTLDWLQGPPLTLSHSPVIWGADENLFGSAFRLTGKVTPEAPVDARIFPSGVDLDVGRDMRVLAVSHFATSYVSFNATYSLI